MRWIVQSAKNIEDRENDLIEALKIEDIPYDVVRILPFTHKLDPEISITSPVIVCGTTKLIKIAMHQKWSPGVWYNDNFNCMTWRNGPLAEYMLNSDLEISTFEEVCFKGDKFIRPVEDLKLFSGAIVNEWHLKKWKRRQLDYNREGGLSKGTLVAFSSCKYIKREYRIFVVDGRVSTASQYMDRGILTMAEFVPEEVIKFVSTIIRLWTPANAFVVDVAEIKNGKYKIIEFNCINGSGLYRADVRKYVRDLTALAIKEYSNR